ncbi:hypothetical protein POVCU2_0011410 [Plasmodium ovale curtisi]|uniref:Uncharacterized protein n=1 Tax=Plasmodium ovale curtisi TaxID=864141 RepID=A0A1A8VPT4_PLAOA|nr:hypothetical protein POVCU2_0011410 [Plasmodium ovale curtisi]
MTSGRIAKRVDELQGEWANCKTSGRIAKRVGELQNEWANCKTSGRIAKRVGELQNEWAIWDEWEIERMDAVTNTRIRKHRIHGLLLL